MLVAIGIAAVAAILVIGLQIAGAVIARHRVEAAADLAALAGSTRALFGDACERAGVVAAANGARVDECSLDGLDVRVVVSAPVSLGVFGGTVSGRARAGPVNSTGKSVARWFANPSARLDGEEPAALLHLDLDAVVEAALDAAAAA